MPGSRPFGTRSVRPTRWGIASLACCALGTWLRIDYALVQHHLRHRATSDALLYLERAQELLQRGAVPNLPATIWPPGTSALWAALSAIDPSQQLSAAWNAGASILVMPLTAATAGLLAGTRAAWIALAIAALHPGFIHYSGFALAEQPFQLAIAVALYLTLSALVRLEAEPLPRAATERAANTDANSPAASTAPTVSASSGADGGGAGSLPDAEPTPTRTGAYITAEVMTETRPRNAAARGKLAHPSPGGGSALGKWFGRFRAPSEPPPPEPEFTAARRGFIGRGSPDAGASSARRSAFADRGPPEVFGRAGRDVQSAARESLPGSDASAKRGAGLAFGAGANGGASEATDSATAGSGPREPWTGGLDPKLPAGELRRSDAAPARDANALAAELASQFAAGLAVTQASMSQTPSTVAIGHEATNQRSAAAGGEASTPDAVAQAHGGGSRAAHGSVADAAAPGGSAAAAHSSVTEAPGGEASTTDAAPRADAGTAGATDSSVARASAPSGTFEAVSGEPSDARADAGNRELSRGDDGGTSAVERRTGETGSHERRTAPHALAGAANLWFAGSAIGCAWALASLIRPNALPVAAFGALALLLLHRRTPPRAIWAALGAGLAASLVLTAAAHRCTATANGRFCVVSNNIAMNVALGQAGPVSGLEFRDPRRPELTTTWIAPSLAQHGYRGVREVPASVYDASGVFHWVGARFAEDPVAFAVRAVGNAFDLFNLAAWPDEFGRFSERTALVLRQAWNAVVFVPAFVALLGLGRRAFSPTPVRPAAIFVLGALLGLTLSAALSLGESRYRIPFDGLWIGLASAAYAGASGWYALDFVPAESLGARHWVAWSHAVVLCSVALLALTHPGLNLGLLLPQRGAALPNRGQPDTAAAAAFATPQATGAAWNGPGNYVWRCQPDCGELRVRFEARRRARRVNLSVDHNDRYRLLFYRSGQLQAFTDVPPALDVADGLQNTTIEVPAGARAGFDAIGVQPLYGDGSYSLGHLRLD